MAYRIEYISTFHRDVLDAVVFMEDYQQKAKRIFEKLDKKLSSLVENPEMYPIYPDFPEFRRIIIEDYLVFYVVKVYEEVIEVHRLINGRMDISALLNNE